MKIEEQVYNAVSGGRPRFSFCQVRLRAVQPICCSEGRQREGAAAMGNNNIFQIIYNNISVNMSFNL